MEDKIGFVLQLVSPGGRLADAGRVLVYCAFRSDAELLAARLQGRGIRAAAYHAGKHPKVGRSVVWMHAMQLLASLVEGVGWWGWDLGAFT